MTLEISVITKEELTNVILEKDLELFINSFKNTRKEKIKSFFDKLLFPLFFISIVSISGLIGLVTTFVILFIRILSGEIIVFLCYYIILGFTTIIRTMGLSRAFVSVFLFIRAIISVCLIILIIPIILIACLGTPVFALLGVVIFSLGNSAVCVLMMMEAIRAKSSIRNELIDQVLLTIFVTNPLFFGWQNTCIGMFHWSDEIEKRFSFSQTFDL